MSSSSLPEVNIIVDNLRSDAFSYQGSWSTNQADQWFNGTLSSAVAANGTVTLTFNGTSVAFIGTTPPSSQPQTFLVSIDKGTRVNTSFSDPNPSSYRQWYQTPTLSDGLHTITLSNLAGSSIDFALVTVGAQTPIKDERIIVDDNASGLNFSAGWRKDKDKFNVGGSAAISGFTLSNSTHDTETVGSSFSYKFSGTAIAIYGLFDFSSPSLLSLSFSIDSQSLSQTYRVTTSSPQLVAELGQQPNYLFYSYDFLTTGEHTLVVNVTECLNQTFRFDYLTYVPAFAKISDMPKDSGGSSGAAASPGSGNKGVKSIVGGVVGAVVGSVLLGVLLFLFLKRRARRRKENDEFWGKSILAPPSSPGTTRNDHGLSPLLTTTSPSSSPHSLPNPNPLGPMALMQNTSAVQYGLNFPHGYDSHSISNSGHRVQSGATWDTQSHMTDGQTIYVDPPSYDEVTSAPPS